MSLEPSTDWRVRLPVISYKSEITTIGEPQSASSASHRLLQPSNSDNRCPSSSYLCHPLLSNRFQIFTVILFEIIESLRKVGIRKLYLRFDPGSKSNSEGRSRGVRGESRVLIVFFSVFASNSWSESERVGYPPEQNEKLTVGKTRSSRIFS
jgi:hypothetical protein